MLKIILLVVVLVAQSSYSRVIKRQDGLIRFDDMLLTPEQYYGIKTRKMVPDTNYFWPKTSEGVVEILYKIEDPTVKANLVLKGQADWEKYTCVKFKELKGDTEGKTYFKYTSEDQNNCWAQLGMIEGQGAPLNIGWNSSACNFEGVIHEIGHTLGFYHEMSRSDRDSAIIVLTENLVAASQFTKANTNNYGIPYDYMSIMHYQSRAGSTYGTNAMLSTDPRFQEFMGEYKDFSFMDLLLFNKAYKCIDDWLKACKLTEDPCKNMGYTGKDCKCLCPPGTNGDKCENKVMSYNDALMAKLNPYSKMYTTANSIVSTPNHPSPPKDPMLYTQVIKAPEGQRVVLTFEDFNIDEWGCRFDYLLIRSEVTESPGQKFCGKQISKGQVFKSTKSMLILDYRGDDYTFWTVNPFTGYKAVVTFEPIK